VTTFCLIHGNWHDGSCWAPLGERLRSRGHEVLAPDLPFDDATATYEERARPAATALVDAEQPIVVVGHSAGSAEAALVAAERKAARLASRLQPGTHDALAEVLDSLAVEMSLSGPVA
jgi:pimeloyl-ACP methyl ester carboxylesterase